MPNVTDLVKNVAYKNKIPEVENKYFTTSDYNKFIKTIA